MRFFLFSLLCLAGTVVGQTIPQVSESSYKRATEMLSGKTSSFIDRAIAPQWLPDNRLWYRLLTETESKFVLFNPVDGKRVVFNTQKELNEFVNKKNEVPNPIPGGVISPDGKQIAFIRNWNLWLRDLATGNERALTTDGIKDFGYATDNAGWTHSDAAILKWSPDSKKIATFQQDQRHIHDMYLVKTKVGYPELEAWKYPLPGDSMIIKIHRVIIDLTKPDGMVRFKMQPDDRRGTLCDDISCSGGFDDVVWSEDGKQLAFASVTRDHKQVNLRLANAETGEVREVLEEKVATQYESGQGAVNWTYFAKTNEILWYSERSDWGHLYLYDANTGKLKNQITSGNYVVQQVIHIDQKNRFIYFIGSGKETGVNPYFRYLYRVDFNGKETKLLSPGVGDHTIRLSPDQKYFVDSYSQPDVPPVHEVRDSKGKLVAVLDRTEITRLKAMGWRAPMPFSVKSADQRWDLYGLMYTPSVIEPDKKYPVIVYIYPGPQGGSVGSWSFAASRGDCNALAELGFVVVQLEGSCNPERSKSFHDACYGNMGENTLPDQIAGLRQLKTKYNYLDLDKVGIWGHSGGGFATAAAMFKYPEFFKVGISESGNHDNRNYEDDWGERYNGLEVMDANCITNYELQANQTHAPKLTGKLLLIHGAMDDNVPHYNTFLVVNALIKANKDFDLLILPNARHGYGADSFYVMRRRWDYFVEHLLEAEPPKEFQIKMERDPRIR